MNTPQNLFPFEAETVAAEAAKCEAQRAAERHEREAKEAAKILAALARQKQKAEEEMAKNARRWKREEATRKRNDTLTAQCGINWYSRRRDAGIYWTHCRTCGQLLIYTDDRDANPRSAKAGNFDGEAAPSVPVDDPSNTPRPGVTAWARFSDDQRAGRPLESCPAFRFAA
jgi:hypothetical protein